DGRHTPVAARPADRRATAADSCRLPLLSACTDYPPYRRLDAVVRHAATQRAIHGCADLRIAGIGIAIKQCLRGHDLPVLAIAALGSLLVDPRLLQWMQLPVARQALEGRH